MHHHEFRKQAWTLLLLLVVAVSFTACTGSRRAATDPVAQLINTWPVHDMTRPVPTAVTPGTFSTDTQPGKPPSDAIVLFDGRDLSRWQHADGKPAAWKVENGYFEVVKGTGQLFTRQEFGDVQLHVEWASPAQVEGESQGRGNSGVFFGRDQYEVQVLDSYNNRTYADGQASALYGQYPPIVNVTRAPGEWQVYDIIFRRPRFNDKGEVVSPARITVLHNGVVTQDGSVLTGPTGHHMRPPYQAHDRLPISLQDHGNPVRFRNIWVRDLEQYTQFPAAPAAARQ